MNREEVVNNIGYQMTHAAMEYIQAHEFSDRIDNFEAGAEWMQKKMIEKACKWIKVNMPNYINFEEGFIYEVDMADDFRKAMEE